MKQCRFCSGYKKGNSCVCCSCTKIGMHLYTVDSDTAEECEQYDGIMLPQTNRECLIYFLKNNMTGDYLKMLKRIIQIPYITNSVDSYIENLLNSTYDDRLIYKYVGQR